MHIKPISRVKYSINLDLYIRHTLRTKPRHYKINKIINKDKTYMCMQENTLKNLNYVNKLILTEVCILFKVGIYFKINKLSK